jgi:LmbE family N-acetylglucosaminyl deacetylase
MTEAQNPLTPSLVTMTVRSANLPTPTSALAIAAHADDAEFGCGATLAKWAADGCVVHVLVCTDGSKGTWDPDTDQAALIAIRQEEQRQATKALGGSGEVGFLGQVDGELDSGLDQRASVARFIRQTRPSVILGHDPWKRYRLHPDHRHAGLLTAEGLVAAREPTFAIDGLPAHRPDALLLFEADEPDHVEDVTGFAEAKIAALACHESQFESTMRSGDDPDLVRFRQRVVDKLATAGRAGGVAHAEVFKLIDDL